MQNRLLAGLTAAIQRGRKYILDGHFCLFNKDGEVTPVPLSTFEGIAPEALVLITGEAQEIASSLQLRDKRFYDPVILSQMQELEISHARLTAKHLLLPLVIFDKNLDTPSNLIKRINESLA
jgi:adenylate kinase